MIQKLPKSKDTAFLAVPLSIRIFRKCTEHRIDFNLVQHLHFYDLQCLIFQLEAQKIQEYLNAKEKDRLRSRGISEIKEIDGSDAVKFLKGGESKIGR